MLKSIHLQGYKAHLDTTVPLERLTVFVGPNGSGQTSALDSCIDVGRLATGEAPIEVFKSDREPGLLQRRPSTEQPWGYELKGSHQDVEFACSATWPTHAPSEGFWAPHIQTKPDWSSRGPASEVRDADRVLRHLGSTTLYHLHSPYIAAPGSSRSPLPHVERDGWNVAAALKAIKLSHDDVWTQIQHVVRAVVPEVQSLGIEQVPNPAIRRAEPEPSGEWAQVLFNFSHAKRVPASAISEGTLLTLALATILLHPERPDIVLIDDIEKGLHPVGQRELITQLKKLLSHDAMKHAQVLATTHSPYILDPLDFKQVRVFALDSDEATRVKSLADHPGAAKLEGSISPGELWTADPESSWVVDEKQ